jgi:glyoxylase I family protein
MDRTVTLYRPTGSKEIDLVRDSGFKKWPPRLPEQPIFYPVTNEEYAIKIACDWNVKESEYGCVTRFQVRQNFMDRYEIKQVGGENCTEWWIPAEEVDLLNDNIVGNIEIIHEFYPDLPTIPSGDLRGIHHVALNVKNLRVSREFYGRVLGLHELTGDEVPATLTELVAVGKVANFRLPDGKILDLFSEPTLSPPDNDPSRQFTRVNHLAFDIDPQLFDSAVAVLSARQVNIESGPVARPTGRGIYFYDPDGFLLEIRCNPS